MRLTYTADPPTFLSSPSDQAYVEQLVRDRAKVGLKLGALYRTLLISPPFTRGFHDLFTAIRYKSTLEPDLREMAMCRVGALNSAAFEWMHHAPLLKKAGVGDEGVETVRTAVKGEQPPESSLGDFYKGLSRKQWKVMRYVDAVTRDISVSDEVFEDMKTALEGDERKVVELTLTICGYNAVSRFLRAVDVAEMKDLPVGSPKAKL